MTAISIRGLTKSYGRVKALKGIDLELRPGNCGIDWAQRGGKVDHFEAAHRPDDADLRRSLCLELMSRTAWRARRLIGYVPEEPALYDYLTARGSEFIASIREWMV